MKYLRIFHLNLMQKYIILIILQLIHIIIVVYFNRFFYPHNSVANLNYTFINKLIVLKYFYISILNCVIL